MKNYFLDTNTCYQFGETKAVIILDQNHLDKNFLK